MSNFPSISELLTHTAVRVALAIVGLILVGGIAYYLIESQPPKVAYATVSKGNITEDVTAIGVVSPVQNPTLSFEQGGQVTTVHASAGEKVTTGTLLATLDTGVLSASLAAAQATLNNLEAPPRGVDVAGQQTGVLTAQQTLANSYANYPQTLQTTLSSAQSTINSEIDPLFNFSNPAEPALNATDANSSDKVVVDEERAELNTEFTQWQSELSAQPSGDSASQFQTVTKDSITHLDNIRSFLNDLVTALNSEATSGAFSSEQSSGIAAASSALGTINDLITSLTNADQAISTEELAVQSAQDQLNATNAGATPQAIQAQEAQVAGIEAQLKQQEIIAPFSGTIASVSIKPGDAVTANTAAISLIPNGTFEVDLYLAENDVTKVTAGDKADVTLDAYGASRIFSATVGVVETSPSIDPNSAGGTSGGYKVTLIFDNADPAITNGMHASATIHAGTAQNVLVIPSSAVITDGTSQFVLKQTANGLVKTPITLGLISTSTVEVLSGLAAGDSISSVGAQD